MKILVVKYKCKQNYENTIVALKTALSIGAEIAYLQKPFIRNRNFSHSIFNFYWLGRLKNKEQVFTAIKNELISRIVVDNKTHLVDHPYFLVLNI